MKAKAHILVVDDEPSNRLILQDLLESYYSVHALANGRQALDYLRTAGRQVDLILLDVIMPEMDGFEACQQIKGETKLRDIPILFLTSLSSVTEETHGLTLGAVDFIRKPFSPLVVLARVRSHLELTCASKLLSKHNVVLEYMVLARTRALLHEKEQVIATQESTIRSLCSLAEIRDNETGNHIWRTQRYVRALAKRLSALPQFAAELSDDTIGLLFRSAPLHDIGKVAIPDAILLKPGKLTDEEWIVMKRHAEYGRDALVQVQGNGNSNVSFLKYAREIAYCHHEKWDGSGYPQGLSGCAIPLSARIMAVADVYDALISKRVYKPAFAHEKAIGMIILGRATHFDPQIVDVLPDVAEEFWAIAASDGGTSG